jgi:hypothetical protein
MSHSLSLVEALVALVDLRFNLRFDSDALEVSSSSEADFSSSPSSYEPICAIDA